MNSGIELHDSTLASIQKEDSNLVVCLAPTYVHRSPGRPGVDPGSGGLQDVGLRLADAVVECASAEFPVGIAAGSILVGAIL